MRFAFTSALKDLQRLRREPVTILTWLGIPTFIAVILVVIFGRGGAQPSGKLLVVDEDQSGFSNMFLKAFDQGSLRNIIAVEKVTRDAGRQRIEAGKASALLTIPADFSASIFQGNPAKLHLVRNPAQRVLPDIIEEVLSTSVDIASSFQRGGLPADTLQHPLIQLETRIVQQKMDQPGAFALLMLPGMLYMAVFFIAGGMASDVWRERTSGALRRVVTTPASFRAFLAGKVFAALLVLALVGAFGLAVAHFLVDLPVSNFTLAALWIALSGAGLYLFMMGLQSLASNERVAGMLNNFVMLPLTMLGGSFFPFELMPQSFARIGRVTPNGWSLVQLQNILSGHTVPFTFAPLLVFIALAWLLVARRIRSGVC